MSQVLKCYLFYQIASNNSFIRISAFAEIYLRRNANSQKILPIYVTLFGEFNFIDTVV